MSLPFGFSPFDDDYDSPYAHTNAAIRRQSRSGVPLPSGQSQHSNASSQLGSPFSSRQQAQSQPQSRSPTRPSSRGQLNATTTGDALNEPLPTRKSSPPPEIPAAEDFGSNKRFPQQASRSPSGDVRAITQPTPMGAPLAAAFASSEDKQSSPPKVTPVAVTPPQSPSKSPPASPSPSQRRRPPPPPAATAAGAAPRATPPSSPLAGSASPRKTDKSVKDSTDKKQKTDKAAKKNESAASAAATTSTTQSTPSSSSRWSWIKGSSAKAAAPAAGAAAAVAATKGKGKSPESEEAGPPAPPSSTPASPPSPKTAAPVAPAASAPAAKPAVSQSSPPAPVVHDLPEPAAPPAPAQVALATPADQEAEQQQQPEQQVPTTTSPAPQAQEMHEIGRSDSNSNNKPATPFAPVTPVTSIGDNSDANGARDHHSTSPLSSPSEGPAASRTSFSSTRSHRRGLGAVGAGAGVGVGAATAGTAFAAESNARPAHTAYDMGDNSASSPFSEKADNPREPLAGSGAAGLPTHNAKRNNESSRFSHANSYSAAGAGAGGGALARSWRNHKKAWIIGGIIALIVIIAAAVGGGVGGSSSSSGKGTTNGGGNGQDKGTGSGGTGIKADSRLHNSFFGINYTPFQSLAPACGVNITGVVDDLKLISQLTSRVRLAGSACNETAMVLDAIQRLDVDLTVYPSIAITDATTLVSTDWTNQVNFVTDAMNTFGNDRIGGVQVGDDYITNIGSQATLLRFVEAFRTALAGSSGLANVPVGTAEASSTWSASLVQSVDFIFANNQAWYSGIAINNAASWTASYFQSTIGDMLDDVTNAPPAFISETGWPTGAFTQAQATEDAAIASVANLQTYLDTFICQANTNGTGYFFFEMFDDPNLANAAGGVGGYWGLFDSDKNLKDITIPKCSHR